MQENEDYNGISTKTKIQNLLNDLQNTLNNRVGYSPQNVNTNNIDIFQSFGGIQAEAEKTDRGFNSKGFKTFGNFAETNSNLYKISPSTLINQNSNTNNNYVPFQFNPRMQTEVSPFNEFYIRNIIKEEFSNMIVPYQKDIICNVNSMQTQMSEIENKFQIIINAQNNGNLNDNAKIIGAYLCNNFENNSSNKALEKLKVEYAEKFDDFEKNFNSMCEQVAREKNNSENNFNQIFNKISNIEKENEERERNKDTRTYVEKYEFENIINEIRNKESGIINENANNVNNIENKIEDINKNINLFKLDINKINFLSNDILSIRTDFGKITEDVSQVKYLVTPELVTKINNIDFNALKQLSPKEFSDIKNNIKFLETNLNAVKTMAENTDRGIYDLSKNIKDVEQKNTNLNKNVQPLIDEKLSDKIKDLNNKFEELTKNKNDTNNNLDEKSKNLLMQLEKINLSELQKLDFNNISNKINNLTDENVKLSAKIEEQNKQIADIISKINNMKNTNTNLNVNPNNNENVYNPISSEVKMLSGVENNSNKNIDFNENTSNNKNINSRYNNPITNDKNNNIQKNDDANKVSMSNDKKNEQIASMGESNVYDDFDKDFDDTKNDLDKNDLDKNDFDKKDYGKNDFDKNDFGKNDFDTSKNEPDFLKPINAHENLKEDKFETKNKKSELGGFDNYEGTNILDQIMGGGIGSRRGGSGIGGIGGNKDYGGTFITGQLNNDKKNDLNFDDFDNKPNINDKKEKEYDDILDDNDFKTENVEKPEVKKEEPKDKKEEVDLDDNFDDFDDIEDI